MRRKKAKRKEADERYVCICSAVQAVLPDKGHIQKPKAAYYEGEGVLNV